MTDVLIQQPRDLAAVLDVQFDASWIFTSNDTLVNLGIVASGLLVMLLESPVPDLLIGLVTAAVAARGGKQILDMAREAGA